MATTGYSARPSSYWQMKRRRFLQAGSIGGISLAATALVGCGDDKGSNQGAASPAAPSSNPAAAAYPPPPTYTSKQDVQALLARYSPLNVPKPPDGVEPRYGGTHKTTMSPIPHFDMVGADNSTTNTLAMRAYNRLLDLQLGPQANNLGLDIKGDLANSYEVTDGGTKFIFKLHPGAKFQNVAPVNGRALTSEDVKYALERYKSNSAYSVMYEEVERFETPDATTFTIVTKQPTAYMLLSLASPNDFIFPREIEADLKSKLIGSGPMIAKQIDQNTGATWVKNPDYWKTDAQGRRLPYLDGVSVKVISDPQVFLSAYGSGEVDYYRPANPDLLKTTLGLVPQSVVEIIPQSPQLQSNLSPQVDAAPFNDVRVRRALSLIVDRQVMIDSVFGGSAVATNYLPFDHRGRPWPEAVNELGPWMSKPDIQQAKQLMEAAGHGGGFKTRVAVLATINPLVQSSIELVQQWLKAINVDMVIDKLQAAQFYQELLTTGKRDGFTADFNPVAGYEPDLHTYWMYHSKSPRNLARVSNPELDRLTELQRRELDNDKRRAIIVDTEKILLDQVYRVGLAWPWTITAWRPNLMNYAEHLWAYVSAYATTLNEVMWIKA